MQARSDFGLGIMFAAGYHARSLETPRSAAPGEPRSAGYLSWLAGWDEAEASEAESRIDDRRLPDAPEQASALQ
jgi:hypothetical protein